MALSDTAKIAPRDRWDVLQHVYTLIMETLHFSIVINAPRAQVSEAMLADATYREWTSVFSPGSYYQGDWSKGSKMLFLGPDPETGIEGGMVSRIAAHVPSEFVSVEHLGFISDGVEDTTSEAVSKWMPAFENYTFRDSGEGTEVLIDVDIHPDYKAMFEELWPKALVRLKEVVER